MPKSLAAYLERIHFDGTPQVDYDTLRRIHRQHLQHIPYENLDIHRGRTLSLDGNLIFDKLVTGRRGGWCYEMNGLMAWALREIGFTVTLLGGTVNRQARGDEAQGNHLVLRVDLDRPYLADAGFGNGILEPLPLVEGVYQQGFLRYQLSHDDAGRWLFECLNNASPGFDFSETPYQMDDFAAQCQYLQTSPNSGFLMLTVCHKRSDAGIVSLRGVTLKRITENGETEQIIDNHADYDRILREEYDLHLDDSAVLWDKIWRDYQAWLKIQASAS